MVCIFLGAQYNFAANYPKIPSPTSLKSLGMSSGDIKVSWGAVPGASGYILYRSETKAGVYSYLISTKATNYTDTKLSDKKTYYYKLKTFKIIKGVKIYSEFSNIIFAKANKLKPIPKAILKVGLDNTYPPMEYLNANNENVGFDIDFANEIGKRLNMEIKFIPTSWSSIFAELEQKKFDCILSSLTITEERKKRFLFTQSYLTNNQVIVIPTENKKINNITDLKDKIVGVQRGTTGEEAGEKFNAENPFKLFNKYDELNEILLDLKNNKLDAIILDKFVASYFVSKNANKFKLVDTSLGIESIGACFMKEESDIYKKVDNVISQMKKDGSLKKISIKWFGIDLSK